MAQIRNGKLAAGRITKGGGAIAYQVPVGFGAIVKFVGMTPLESLAWDATIGVVGANEGVVVWLVLQQAQASTTVIWNQWVALDAGDYIQMGSNAVDFNFYISGAELPYLSTLGAAAAAGAVVDQVPPFEPPADGGVLYVPR